MTIVNLNLEISTLSMVKMMLTQIVRKLIREKKRLQLFLPSNNIGYNYERNTWMPLRYKVGQYY
jgi:hypothetical protein